MSLVDGHVTKVNRIWNEPEYKNLPWLVEVEYWDDGGQSKTPTVLMFETEEKANNVNVGFIFQH